MDRYLQLQGLHKHWCRQRWCRWSHWCRPKRPSGHVQWHLADSDSELCSYPFNVAVLVVVVPVVLVVVVVVAAAAVTSSLQVIVLLPSPSRVTSLCQNKYKHQTLPLFDALVSCMVESTNDASNVTKKVSKLSRISITKAMSFVPWHKICVKKYGVKEVQFWVLKRHQKHN